MSKRGIPITITISLLCSLFIFINIYLVMAEEYVITIVPNAANVAEMQKTHQGSSLPFDPSPLQIKNGSIVTWINKDSNPHSVVSGDPDNGPDNKIDSGIIDSGKNFSHTFNKLETINYFDSFNTKITGTIEVLENVTQNETTGNGIVKNASNVVTGIKK